MKKVLITGGATGIGKACCELFYKSGYDVYLTYNKTKPDFDFATAIKCNLENEKEIKSLFENFNSLDVLVNNAGVSLIKLATETTNEEYEKIMSVNARASFICAKEATKLMLKTHSGSIINISSMWGEVGASCEVVYSMSKSAVIGLTKALSKELAPSGITVNCVSPGIIDTRMNNQFDKVELEEEVPMNRLGTAKEVANAVFFFANSSYVTGQVLGVNGGII